jgi:hypothetical protein
VSPLSPAPPLSRISPLRLLGLLVLFVGACLYAILHSERFQREGRALLVRTASAALDRPVTFRDLSVTIVPPSVSVTDFRVAGIGGEARPFFEADEASLSGRVTFVGRTLSLGTIRLEHPRLNVVVFPDGTSNLPAGLSRKAGPSPLRVEIARLAVHSGEFELNERRARVDFDLHGFALDMIAEGGRGRFRGRLGCRSVFLRLPDAEPMPMRLEASFDLEAGRLHVDSLSIHGDFGTLEATAEVPVLARPVVTATVTGSLHAGRIERLFRTSLPFEGLLQVEARVVAGKDQPFRVDGRAEIERVDAHQFVFDRVSSVLTADPSGVVVRIEQAEFEGGRVSGVLHIGAFHRKPQTFDLMVDAEGLSVDRFFGDIGLAGTGLDGRARLTLALAWSGGALDRGNGGAVLTLAPGAAVSESAVPTSGGGTASIRDGFISFQGAVFRFPETSLQINGGFPIGSWDPRLRFVLQSSDLRVVDRLATNFASAIARAPAAPYGLAGKGRIEGALAGRWADPEVSARISAEEAQYARVRFGSVFADMSVADGAFVFHPLRAYDGDASLFLSGRLRYRPKPGAPRFDMTAQAKNFPLERVLDFLDLDYPVTGRISGTLPFAGDAASLRGTGSFELAGARVYGQPVEDVTGTAVFKPGRISLEKARGRVGAAWIGGSASYEIGPKRFEFRLAGDDVALSDVEALEPAAESLSGRVSFQVGGDGSVEQPSIQASLRMSELALFGRPVPPEVSPSATIRFEDGRLSAQAGAPGRWSVEAEGPVSGDRSALDISVSIPDLHSLAAVVGGTAAELAGEAQARGRLELDPRTGAVVSANGTVTGLRLATQNLGAELSADGPVGISYAKGILSIPSMRLTGPRSSIDLGLAVDLSHEMALGGRIRASLDPAVLAAIVLPGAETAGRLTTDLSLSGSLGRPLFRGTARLEGGRLVSPALPYVLENVDASVQLRDDRISVESFHAQMGGGDLFVSGDARLSGYVLSQFRLLAQAQNVAVRSLEGLRLQANADLTATGTLDRSTVRGEVTLLSGTYTRDFAPTLASLFARARAPGLVAASATWKDRVSLEVHIGSAGALEVRNNLASLTAWVDLIARGTLSDPVLVGQVTVDEGGKVTFQDVRYEIQSGTITFGNPQRTEPFFDIAAVAEVRNYSINVQAVGSLGERARVQFHLSSDPPLSDEQIASLLLTGGSPVVSSAGARPTSQTTTTSVVGSIAGLAFRPVTSKVQELFRLDRFQVDPILQSRPGASAGAVITIGKNLSKNLSVTYSYSAESNAQSILLVEYQLDANKVLQASKDENNVYSINIKIRKRL